MGTCSRLSERLIRDGRDSAKRVVSDTDTPEYRSIVLLPNLQSTSFGAPVTAIVIKLYLNVRLGEFPLGREIEDYILNALAALQPLLLVMCLD